MQCESNLGKEWDEDDGLGNLADFFEKKIKISSIIKDKGYNLSRLGYYNWNLGELIQTRDV